MGLKDGSCYLHMYSFSAEVLGRFQISFSWRVAEDDVRPSNCLRAFTNKTKQPGGMRGRLLHAGSGEGGKRREQSPSVGPG